jgi:hypothetical protein
MVEAINIFYLILARGRSLVFARLRTGVMLILKCFLPYYVRYTHEVARYTLRISMVERLVRSASDRGS